MKQYVLKQDLKATLDVLLVGDHDEMLHMCVSCSSECVCAKFDMNGRSER